MTLLALLVYLLLAGGDGEDGGSTETAAVSLLIPRASSYNK